MASDYPAVDVESLAGMNQELKQGTHHWVPITPHSNKLLPGTLPRASSGPVGGPNRANPLGVASYIGD